MELSQSTLQQNYCLQFRGITECCRHIRRAGRFIRNAGEHRTEYTASQTASITVTSVRSSFPRYPEKNSTSGLSSKKKNLPIFDTFAGRYKKKIVKGFKIVYWNPSITCTNWQFYKSKKYDRIFVTNITCLIIAYKTVTNFMIVILLYTQ